MMTALLSILQMAVGRMGLSRYSFSSYGFIYNQKLAINHHCLRKRMLFAIKVDGPWAVPFTNALSPTLTLYEPMLEFSSAQLGI